MRLGSAFEEERLGSFEGDSWLGPGEVLKEIVVRNHQIVKGKRSKGNSLTRAFCWGKGLGGAGGFGVLLPLSNLLISLDPAHLAWMLKKAPPPTPWPVLMVKKKCLPPRILQSFLSTNFSQIFISFLPSLLFIFYFFDFSFLRLGFTQPRLALNS